MRYYKYIYSDDEIIRGIPGFAFISVRDALAYSDTFKAWAGPAGGLKGRPTPVSLYQFDGVDPTPFPIMFSSELTIRFRPRRITDEEATKILEYFKRQDDDFFWLAASTNEDYQMFMDLANHVKALKPQDINYGGITDVEAFYYDTVTMRRIADEAEVLQLRTNMGVVPRDH